MRRIALCATAILCLPALLGCQTTGGWFGKKGSTVSAAPAHIPAPAPAPDPDPDYYADSSSDYQPIDPYEPIVPRNSTPTLSAPVSSDSITPAGARFHTVAKGDTLYALARQYYSDQRRWKDIFEANRDGISNANKIRVGQRLVIP